MTKSDEVEWHQFRPPPGEVTHCQATWNSPPSSVFECQGIRRNIRPLASPTYPGALSRPPRWKRGRAVALGTGHGGSGEVVGDAATVAATHQVASASGSSSSITVTIQAIWIFEYDEILIFE